MTITNNRRPLYFWLVICLLVTIAQAVHMWNILNISAEKINQKVIHETEKASREISQKIDGAMTIIHDFEEQISDGSIPKSRILKTLENKFRDNPQLSTLNITYKPFLFDENREYFSPYFDRINKQASLSFLTGYTEKSDEFAWYHETLSNGNQWTEPYFEPTTGVLMTTYAVPFYANSIDRQNKQNPIGVIPTDIDLNTMTRSLSSLQLGNTGYGFVVSKKGFVLTYPIFDFVKERRSIHDLIKDPDHEHLKAVFVCLSDRALNKVIKAENQNTGESFYFGCKKIPHAHWTLVTVFSADEKALDTQEIRKDFIKLISILLVLFVIIFSLALNICDFNQLNWKYSIYVSFGLVAAIISVLFVTHHYIGLTSDGSVTIINKAGRNSFIEQQIKHSRHKRGSPPQFIPTGVHIQSLEFKTANNVFLTGYIWQIYPPDMSIEIEKGFIFPEAVSVEFREEYQRQTKTGNTVIGWYVEATLRQDFNYSQFPFDFKNVWIRMWHKDFDKNIILIPDLESYQLFNPSAKPGLDHTIVLPDWNINGTDFSYRNHSYITNFGIDSYEGNLSFPELYFNIHIDRKFLSPFISIILPFFVIMTLLFAIVVDMPNSGIGTFLTEASALIFTILLAHFSLRKSIHNANIVYIEYFYFVLYMAILILIAITFLYHSKKHPFSFTENQCRITKLLYWPGILGVLYLITVANFYH